MSVTTVNELNGPVSSAAEQVRRWVGTPVEFWEECARLFGTVVRLDLGTLGLVVLISDPQTVKQVFMLPQDSFECRQFNEHYRYVMGDNTVLVQDGEQHRRQRRLLLPLLHHRILPSSATIGDTAQRIISTWPVDEPFNPRPSLHEITFRVMMRHLFGNSESESAETIMYAYRDEVLRQMGSWGPWRNFVRLKPMMRRILAEEIQARRAAPELPGVLTTLAQARDSGGLPITDPELEDHIFLLMTAGVDTTAITLTWALYWLCRNGEVRDRLLDELARAGAPRAETGILDLPYLQAVFQETLRMYPTVPTPSGRKLVRDTRIGSYAFPAGTTLVPCAYLVHRCQYLYPESHRFLPDRFLNRRYPPYEYFPFGGGARACLGGSVAEIEFKTILATILTHWAIAGCGSRTIHPSRHGTLLAPSDEFQLRVRPIAGSRSVPTE